MNIARKKFIQLRHTHFKLAARSYVIMAFDSAPGTAEYMADTANSSVQIVAPVVDSTGEAIASSNRSPSHISAQSAPFVSVLFSSGPGYDSSQAASIQDAISMRSSHISSARGQSSSDGEETAQARIEAAPTAQDVANLWFIF